MGKEVSSKKWCWKNRTAICKRIQTGHYITPYTTINSNWIADFNVRTESIQFLQANRGGNLLHTGLKDSFFLTEEI